MRTYRKLAIEILERREVFTSVAGVDSLGCFQTSGILAETASSQSYINGQGIVLCDNPNPDPMSGSNAMAVEGFVDVTDGMPPSVVQGDQGSLIGDSYRLPSRTTLTVSKHSSAPPVIRSNIL